MRALLIILIVTFYGCGVSKRSMKAKDTTLATTTGWENLSQQTKDSARTLYSTIKNNKADYQTFSAKAKLKYQDALGAQPDGQAVIRIKKDSVIWVSVSSSLLSIEAVRLHITPDSIIILNKLDKTVEYQPFSYLQTFTNIPLTFQNLQQLLIGNAIFTGDSITGYQNFNQQITLAVAGAGFENTYQISAQGNIQKSTLQEKTVRDSRTILFYYADYQPLNESFFPYYREIYVEDESKAHAVLNFSQVEFNKELSFSFTVPANYKTK